MNLAGFGFLVWLAAIYHAAGGGGTF